MAIWHGIILLGGPGSGKGTQAAQLAAQLAVAHISTGDLFRENLKAETPLGKLAKQYMDKGELVPDQVTVDMVRERFKRPDCANGFILDGFPRTVAQADALNALLNEMGKRLTVVLNLRAGEQTLVNRLSNRWTCKTCGAVFPAFSKPPRQGCKQAVCDGELYQRADDNPETQRRRIQVYNQQTAPLEAYYAQRRLLAEIDGEQAIEAVRQAITRSVEKTGMVTSA